MYAVDKGMRKGTVLLAITIVVLGFAHIMYVLCSQGLASLRYSRENWHNRHKPSNSPAPVINPRHAAGNCLYWRNTGGCRPDGRYERDRSCTDRIPRGSSGYCQCVNYTVAHSNCVHPKFKCEDMCSTGERVCEGWVTTGVWTPSCARLEKEQKQVNLDCTTTVHPKLAGYCQCANGDRVPGAGMKCGHRPLSCGALCEAPNRTLALFAAQQSGVAGPPSNRAHTRRRRML
eukprot:TRINITY_DN15653_c0_g1_i2.p1 TRINITY_DN15653_c0_g1~~TRINITY_DN15653_c0_g1_i2.p1  ORF type:complete len:231 (-),score=28.35 TRINITY_DN15653_c0_g1_i2:245-937(-)